MPLSFIIEKEAQVFSCSCFILSIYPALKDEELFLSPEQLTKRTFGIIICYINIIK